MRRQVCRGASVVPRVHLGEEITPAPASLLKFGGHAGPVVGLEAGCAPSTGNWGHATNLVETCGTSWSAVASLQLWPEAARCYARGYAAEFADAGLPVADHLHPGVKSRLLETGSAGMRHPGDCLSGSTSPADLLTPPHLLAAFRWRESNTRGGGQRFAF